MRLAAEQVVNLTLKELSMSLVAAEATQGAPQVDRAAPAPKAPAAEVGY
jgi:hypothetical protein